MILIFLFLLFQKNGRSGDGNETFYGDGPSRETNLAKIRKKLTSVLTSVFHVSDLLLTINEHRHNVREVKHDVYGRR